MWKRRGESAADDVDDLIDRYVAWREECSRVTSSYGDWKLAPGADRVLAFAAYVAALDGEACAAAAYRQLVERTVARAVESSGSWSREEDGLLQSS
jgi:hypothetical protein